MKRVLAMLALVLMAMTTVVWAQGTSSREAAPNWPATAEQKQAFWDEVAPLRQSMWQKQDELRALLSNKDADSTQIATLQQELFQLRQEIARKAEAAGMGYGRGRGMRGMGHGGGRGMGYGMRYRTCPFAYQQ